MELEGRTRAAELSAACSPRADDEHALVIAGSKSQAVLDISHDALREPRPSCGPTSHTIPARRSSGERSTMVGTEAVRSRASSRSSISSWAATRRRRDMGDDRFEAAPGQRLLGAHLQTA